MKKKEIIQKSSEFSRIIKKRNGISNRLFIVNIEPTNNQTPKFGITFVKKIGNAVTRNKLKRQVKNIIDNNKDLIAPNNDYIIIIKKEAVNKKYFELETNLKEIFLKIKEKENEKSKH